MEFRGIDCMFQNVLRYFKEYIVVDHKCINITKLTAHVIIMVKSLWHDIKLKQYSLQIIIIIYQFFNI